MEGQFSQHQFQQQLPQHQHQFTFENTFLTTPIGSQINETQEIQHQQSEQKKGKSNKSKSINNEKEVKTQTKKKVPKVQSKKLKKSEQLTSQSSQLKQQLQYLQSQRAQGNQVQNQVSNSLQLESNSQLSNSTDLSTQESRRLRHVEFERKRREELRSCFEQLATSLPDGPDIISSTNKAYKCAVVLKAVEYVKSLESKVTHLQNRHQQTTEQLQFIHHLIKERENTHPSTNLQITELEEEE